MRAAPRRAGSTARSPSTALDLRAGIIHGAWEANLFVSNVFDKQATLSRFNSDNYDASTRSRIFTNRPRTAGVSLQWKF